MFVLQDQIRIAQTGNILLESKIDDHEQYSRWTCLVTSGFSELGEEDELQNVVITIEDETGITRNRVMRNIDKAHQ